MSAYGIVVLAAAHFLLFCTSLMIAAPYGLAITDKHSPEEVAAGLDHVQRPAVIWLHFQDRTGCTESLLQTSQPGFADLILNVISFEYHETLIAGCGLQARQALDEAVRRYAGKYILVVEGSIRTGAHGIYEDGWTYRDGGAGGRWWQGCGDHCDRFLCVVGRYPIGTS